MGDIKLFKLHNDQINELEGQSVAVEKSLQALVEHHMEALLGVRFLSSEYATGKTHRGRIDTLGLDENGAPVIVEYKRALNENVINQGLYYLDWLLDHKGEFTLLVRDQVGREEADTIEWANARLLCIAGDFTKFDTYSVQQIPRNIELLRYRRYGDELLLLELVNATEGALEEDPTPEKVSKNKIKYTTVSEHLNNASMDVKDRFEAMKAFVEALGDDVQFKTLRYYFAFKRLKNFVCAEVRPQIDTILLFLKLDPDQIDLEEGFSRDVREIGHYGTGDLEITIKNNADLEKAKPLIVQSYEKN